MIIELNSNIHTKRDTNLYRDKENFNVSHVARKKWQRERSKQIERERETKGQQKEPNGKRERQTERKRIKRKERATNEKRRQTDIKASHSLYVYNRTIVFKLTRLPRKSHMCVPWFMYTKGLHHKILKFLNKKNVIILTKFEI